MLGAWTMAKPGAQPLVDFTLVNARVAAAQILTHHLHARVEEVEGQSECPDGRRRHTPL